MNDVTVLDVGEDSDKWLVLGTNDFSLAKLSAIAVLHKQLIPGDYLEFADITELILGVDAYSVNECRIFYDPKTELVFQESHVGLGVRGDYEFLGRNAVTLGFKMPSHRDVIQAVESREHQ